jgi:hypothetical protein
MIPRVVAVCVLAFATQKAESTSSLFRIAETLWNKLTCTTVGEVYEVSLIGQEDTVDVGNCFSNFGSSASVFSELAADEIGLDGADFVRILLESVRNAVVTEDLLQLGQLLEFDGEQLGLVARCISSELIDQDIPIDELSVYSQDAITAYQVEKIFGDESTRVIHGRFFDVCLLLQFAYQAHQKCEITLERDSIRKLMGVCYNRIAADNYSGPIVF